MAKIIPFPSPSGLLTIDDIPDRPPLVPWYSGFPEFRHKMQLAPGTLSVCTGHPGHGKSSLMGNIWFNTVAAHGLGITIASFENAPKPAYHKMLRQFWASMPHEQMTDAQKDEADNFIRGHYRFLWHHYEAPTLDWILEWAVKGGNELDVLVIDPWNRLESQRKKDETETEYISWCLRELRRFAVENNCHVQIISHPAKREIRYRNLYPVLEDISGSKNWDNMPDQGFCVHREEFWDSETRARRWDAKVYHLKARFEELGYPCHFDMRLNPRTWRFEMTNTKG
jgi:twinkle protein